MCDEGADDEKNMSFANNIDEPNDELSDDQRDVDDIASDAIATMPPGSPPINEEVATPNQAMGQENENQMPRPSLVETWHINDLDERIEYQPTILEPRPAQ